MYAFLFCTFIPIYSSIIYIHMYIYTIKYDTYYVPLYIVHMKYIYIYGVHMICYCSATLEFTELFQNSFDSLFSHFLGKQQDYKNSSYKVSRDNWVPS